MKRFVGTLAIFAGLLGMPVAHAQSVTNLSIIIQSPASTGISCPINYPTGKTAFAAPLAAGTLVAVCTTTPTGWSGALTLSGADASLFAVSGFNLSVGAAALTVARTYALTVTATP
jgi:hypothetical protein